MCKYCNGERKIESRPNDNVYIEIYGRKLILFGKVKHEHIKKEYPINYCPMCRQEMVCRIRLGAES